MKAILLSFCLSILLSTAWAQDDAKKNKNNSDGETETLLGSGVKISGFGGPMFAWSTLDGNFANFTGGGGAVLFNQSLFIGGFGMGLSNSVPSKDTNYNRMSLSYGGVWMGYNFKPKKLVHFTAGVKIGWGGLNFFNNNSMGNQNWLNNDDIYVLEPELAVEVNVAKFFRISMGGGYRMVNGVDTNAYTNTSLSAPSANLTLKFGWFR
jgi:hypothetical protein